MYGGKETVEVRFGLVCLGICAGKGKWLIG